MFLRGIERQTWFWCFYFFIVNFEHEHISYPFSSVSIGKLEQVGKYLLGLVSMTILGGYGGLGGGVGRGNRSEHIV